MRTTFSTDQASPAESEKGSDEEGNNDEWDCCTDGYFDAA
jgi:hypothetical protein